MGNKRLQIDPQLNLQPSHWEILSSEKYYDIVESKIDTPHKKLQAQMWTIKLQNNRPQKQHKQSIQTFIFRKQTYLPLVKCLGVHIEDKQYVGLCGAQQTVKVLTQRIIARWSDFPQITLQQSIYTLVIAIVGFQTLIKIVGPFQITENMMGINSQGKFKVWLNENFGKNLPNKQRTINQNAQLTEPNLLVTCQTQMAINILHLMQEKCQQGNYPPRLRTKLYKQGKSFNLILKTVAQYIETQNLKIPQKLNPNLNVVNKQFKISDQEPRFSQYSLTQPYKFDKPIKYQQQELQKQQYLPNHNRVVNYIQLKPNKTISRKINRQLIQNIEYHPSQLRGKSRIVKPPQTTYRTIRTINLEIENLSSPPLSPSHIQVMQSDLPKIQNRLKCQTYNYLKRNPNIFVAQSIYQPNLNRTRSQKKQFMQCQISDNLVQSELFEVNNNHLSNKNTCKEQNLAQKYIRKETVSNKRPNSAYKSNIKFNYCNNNTNQPIKNS